MNIRTGLAAAVLMGITFTAVPANATTVTDEGSIYAAARAHGETISGPVYFAPNGIPFAKADSGNIVVGDNDDPVHTQTWIPFTDQIVYLPIDSSTVVDSTPDGPEYITGGIGAKYLSTGGESKWGRTTSAETVRYDGAHAGAVPVTVQTFDKAEAHWTKSAGAHMLGGSIKTKWTELGGLRGPGAAVTDEYPVIINGVKYQEQKFSHGTTIRWSSYTGAFPVK